MNEFNESKSFSNIMCYLYNVHSFYGHLSHSVIYRNSVFLRAIQFFKLNLERKT